MSKYFKKIVFFFSVFFLTNICVCMAATNTELMKLEVNQEGLSPNFTPSQTSYSLFVKDTINSIDVNAVASSTDSTVKVSGNDNLKSGDNTVLIEVTDKNGKENVYTITVTKASDKDKSDSYLQTLIVENLELVPPFVPETLNYDLGSVPNKINNVSIFAAPRQEGATVEISGNENLKDGNNVIKIKVNSEDGSTAKEYTLNLKKDTIDKAISDVVETSQEDSNMNTDKSRKTIDIRVFIGIVGILIIIIIYLVYKLNKKK